MTKFSIDFSDVKGFMTCGTGEHNFKIIESKLNKFTKDGKESQKLNLTCEVFGGNDSGAKVYHTIFLDNANSLYNFLSKIGINLEKKNYTFDDSSSFIGKTFTAIVEHQTYEKSDGKVSISPRIAVNTIKKYEAPKEEIDPFEEFGNEVTINADELPFE